jgi:hypothetical protein
MEMVRHFWSLLLFSGPLLSAAQTTSAGRESNREIQVTANDYAFMPLPANIEHGATVFSFVNDGKVRHELSIGRLKSTATVDQFVKADAGPNRAALIERSVGILIAGPGKSPDGKLLVDLRKGATYVVYCNLVDKPGAPPHMAMGMYTSFLPE